MSEIAEPKVETFTKEFIESLRNEAAGHRIKAADVQLKLDALAGEHTTLKARFDIADAARVVAESAALDARKGADSRIIGTELKAAARASGLIDADDLRLVDIAALKLNDKGEVVGLTELVEGFRTTKPHLFKASAPADPAAPATPVSNSTPVNPPAPKPSGAKHAKDMTPEEYASEKARVISGR